VVYNREKNSVNIELTGKVGAVVNIAVDTGDEKKISDKTLTKLLSIKREGRSTTRQLSKARAG
jgi:hypothetical protein